MRPGRRFWAALAALAIVGLALVHVTMVYPRVHVRWRADLSPAARSSLEQRYHLADPQRVEQDTWEYRLRDTSPSNVGALVRDPAVDDTAYIDRTRLRVPAPVRRIRMRTLPFPLGSDQEFPDATQLFQIQSAVLLACGAALLWIARLADTVRRKRFALIVLLLAAALAYALPLNPSRLRMGDSGTYLATPASFEAYGGVREIRFEAHLSGALLGRLYALYGRGHDAPVKAFDTLMRLATAWFVISALVIGFSEGWTPVVVRYLALVLLAPVTIMYFGYRELGYLSLNIAAFPLMLRGLQHNDRRLEAGSFLAGLGAALHGFGVLSLLGGWIAAVVAPGRAVDRANRFVRILAWGTAAYLGWIAVYVIVLKLSIIPGHADAIPWRPLFTNIVGDHDRIDVAMLSRTGIRDLVFTAWVVGMPLLFIAASLWRSSPHDTRVAIAYAMPSVVFVILFWPIQGVGVEMDLVFAAFPALYALAWVCAHDPRRTTIAALVLASAHLAFWRIVLDPRFVNFTIS